MAKDSFEITSVWVPLNLKSKSTRPEERIPGMTYYATFFPTDSEKTEPAWIDAQKLAFDGWELVGAVPITASSYPERGELDSEIPGMDRSINLTYTIGYELLFKRRIEKPLTNKP